MKRRLWLLPALVAAAAWLLWGVFVLAAWGEGTAEPREAVNFRTGAFAVGLLATVTAGELRRKR